MALFLEQTNNIEPFTSSITIASACNLVYHTLFLKPEQVAIIPPHGYAPDQQSASVLCWLDWMAKTHNTTVRHACVGGEMRIDGYKVDGVDLQNGSILEFQGCLLHGCEVCYTNSQSCQLHHHGRPA